MTSRVKGKDITMSIEEFASILNLPNKGLLIHQATIQSFDDFSDGLSIDTLAVALHRVSLQ